VANKPLLSIIITSYTIGRLKDIFELLDSIKSQTYKNIEVIFVAERSKELYEKVKEYGEKIGLGMFKVLFNYGEPGLSQARNLGIKHANGQIIAFVDDDVVLSSCWAKELVRTFMLDDNIIGVTGPALPLWVDKSLSWLPEELHWLVSCTTWFNYKEIVDVRNVWGHNMSFKSEVFKRIGYFQTWTGFSYRVPLFTSSLGEDVDFSLRTKKIGKRLVYNPKVKVWHKVYREKLSLKFMMERSFWIGRSRRILKKYYGKKDSGENILSTEFLLLRKIFLKIFMLSNFLGVGKFLTVLLILLFVAFGYLFPFGFESKGDFKSTHF
jgi:glycosyltransferase involved in cell wall biosynthesis